MSASGYQHYEARYREPVLPKEFVGQVALVLREHGVEEAQLATLGPGHEDRAAGLAELAREVRELRSAIERLIQRLEATSNGHGLLALGEVPPRSSPL
jgi:hypothetical protein